MMQDAARGHLVLKWENIRKVIIKTDSRLLICYLQISLEWETAAGDQLQCCSAAGGVTVIVWKSSKESGGEMGSVD